MGSSLNGSPGHARPQPRDTRVPLAERLYTLPITAQFGARVAHEVTDEAFAAGKGEYQALCGCVFVPAPMVAPTSRGCPACLGILSASRRAAPPAPQQRRGRGHGLFRRLLPVWQRRRAILGKDITR